MFALKLISKAFVYASLTALLLAGCGGSSSNETVNNSTLITPVPDKTPDDTAPITPVPDENIIKARELSTALSKLRGEIDSIIEQAQYCNASEDCANLALGKFSRSCWGDADTYLAYNPTLLSEDAERQYLQNIVTEYNALDQQWDGLIPVLTACVQNSPPALACIFGQCSNDPVAVKQNQAEVAAQKEQLQQLETTKSVLNAGIHQLIGDANCASTTECKTIGFGSLFGGCGAPDSHLVYSTGATVADELSHKVTEYNRLDKESDGLFQQVYYPFAMYPAVCLQGSSAPTVSCLENKCTRLNLSCDTAHPQPLPSNVSATALKSEIDATIADTTCSEAGHCGAYAIHVDSLKHLETLAFSTIGVSDVAALACKVQQYAQRLTEEKQGMTAADVSVSVVPSECQQSKCVVTPNSFPTYE